MKYFSYGISDSGIEHHAFHDSPEAAEQSKDLLKSGGYRLVGWTRYAVDETVVLQRINMLLALLWWRSLSIAEMRSYERKYHPDRNWLHLGDNAIVEIWLGEGKPRMVLQ